MRQFGQRKFLDVDLLNEKVEGAAIDAWNIADNGFVRPLGAHIAPSFSRGEDRLHLLLRHIAHKVILAADHNGHRVGAYLYLDRHSFGLDAGCRLLTRDGTARIRDGGGLVNAERRIAALGAGALDRDRAVMAGGFEHLGKPHGQRIDRRTAGDHDIADLDPRLPVRRWRHAGRCPARQADRRRPGSSPPPRSHR